MFIEWTRKNLTMDNVILNKEGCLLFDAGNSNFTIKMDIEDVEDSRYYSKIGDEWILLNELIYRSLMGGEINLNDHISFYSRYFNESGDFILTITKIYSQYGISYTQEYHFKDIRNYTFSDVFAKLRKSDFQTKVTLTKTAYILDESDYHNMLDEFYVVKSFIPIGDDLVKDKDFLKLLTPFTFVLNVVFNKTLTIDCDDTWDMKESPYDMLVINGAGSTIKGSFKKRDEDNG